MTLRFETNTRISSLHAISYLTVFGSRAEKDDLALLRSVPLPFPTPEGNKVRLVRTKSKMSHRLTLWIKEKIMTANSVSVVNHLGLAWIPSLKDKALSPTLSPKA